ncbi:hypothetical protein C2845_PM05G24800 [Panicum miliaceum]|uniref:Uncharacterized protein n=1 Tax=Panicum miliaceum TaxID=4540 RepID=A0A3L6ST63_PANMI|nr:hypothetical protein C2845_PM05G24800 [Panicum miliaceum]
MAYMGHGYYHSLPPFTGDGTVVGGVLGGLAARYFLLHFHVGLECFGSRFGGFIPFLDSSSSLCLGLHLELEVSDPKLSDEDTTDGRVVMPGVSGSRLHQLV